MAVKIRLRRTGAKKAPSYRVVVADSRYPRDGRFIEEIGYYNPLTEPSTIKIDLEKAANWIANGAQPTDTVKVLLKKAGLEYFHSRQYRRIEMKELLITIAQGLVEDPSAVEVVEDEPMEDGTVVFHLHVAPDDMGRVIGKQGRIAKAMRTVMRAAATRQDVKVAVEID